MSRLSQRIGIFSGTFDPVHNGHVQFALDALKSSKLDRVFFMVERNPRRKQGVRAFEHRQVMVELAIRDEEQLGSIIIDQDRFTPHETLPLLKQRFEGAQLVLLMGDDMLLHLHEWPHVDELLRSTQLLIGARGDVSRSAERIRVIQGARGMKFNYELFESSNKAISSRVARSKIKDKEQSLKMLDKKVYDYIRRQGLYTPDDKS